MVINFVGSQFKHFWNFPLRYKKFYAAFYQCFPLKKVTTKFSSITNKILQIFERYTYFYKIFNGIRISITFLLAVSLFFQLIFYNQLFSTLNVYFNNPSKLLNNSQKCFNKSFLFSTFRQNSSTITVQQLTKLFNNWIIVFNKWQSYSTEAYVFNNCNNFFNNTI